MTIEVLDMVSRRRRNLINLTSFAQIRIPLSLYRKISSAGTGPIRASVADHCHDWFCFVLIKTMYLLIWMLGKNIFG